MVFFALSGFFIHKSLSSVFESRAWQAYARARANRILPPFVFCMALAIALWLVAPYVFETGTRTFAYPTARDTFSLEGFWSTIAFVNPFAGGTLAANGPLWSLSYEVWYYVLACLFATALAGNRLGWIWLPALAAMTVLQPWVAVYGLVWAGGFSVSILHSNQHLAKPRKLPVWMVPFALYGLLLVAPPSQLELLAKLFYLSCGAWFVCHLAYAVQCPTLRQLHGLSRSAAFSYTLYVIHFPLLLFAHGISSSLLMGVGAMLLVLLMAAIVGLPLERIVLFPLRPSPPADFQQR